jgi:Na+-driven multidrug efflux pump
MRPALCYLFAVTFGLGVVGAWFAVFCDQVVRLTLVSKRFSSGKWSKIKL